VNLALRKSIFKEPLTDQLTRLKYYKIIKVVLVIIEKIILFKYLHKYLKCLKKCRIPITRQKKTLKNT
jgi:hypothetical protein